LKPAVVAIVAGAAFVSIVHTSEERNLAITIVPRGSIVVHHVHTLAASVEPVLASAIVLALSSSLGPVRALGIYMARLTAAEARLLLPRPLWLRATARHVTAFAAVDA